MLNDIEQLSYIYILYSSVKIQSTLIALEVEPVESFLSFLASVRLPHTKLMQHALKRWRPKYILEYMCVNAIFLINV